MYASYKKLYDEFKKSGLINHCGATGIKIHNTAPSSVKFFTVQHVQDCVNGVTEIITEKEQNWQQEKEHETLNKNYKKQNIHS